MYYDLLAKLSWVIGALAERLLRRRIVLGLLALVVLTLFSSLPIVFWVNKIAFVCLVLLSVLWVIDRARRQEEVEKVSPLP